MSNGLERTDSIKELSVKADDLIDKSDIFMKIFTRAADESTKDLVDFKTFDNKKLAKVSERMIEINRATNSFGKQNSQVTSKLMSLNMVSQSPYRRLKQCLAQIEKKRSALKYNIFKLRKKKIKLEKLLHKKKSVQDNIFISTKRETAFDVKLLDLDLEEVELQIQKIACDISDANIYIEASLKEIGMYQDAYEEIKKSNNIPDNWDEEDFEKCEIEEHVKTAFLHCIRDLETYSSLGIWTSEYLEQYGINPHTAVLLCKEYLEIVSNMHKQGNPASIEVLYKFIDKMYDLFKNEYKKAMKRIGLKELISKDYIYIEKEE